MSTTRYAARRTIIVNQRDSPKTTILRPKIPTANITFGRLRPAERLAGQHYCRLRSRRLQSRCAGPPRPSGRVQDRSGIERQHATAPPKRTANRFSVIAPRNRDERRKRTPWRKALDRGRPRAWARASSSGCVTSSGTHPPRASAAHRRRNGLRLHREREPRRAPGLRRSPPALDRA